MWSTRCSNGEYDFVCKRLPPPWHRTYPIGLDVEACSFKVLEKAWNETKEPQHREHVMPYFYENPDKFNILHVLHDPDYGHLRWTVDTPEDLEFCRVLAEHFSGRDDFSWLDIRDDDGHKKYQGAHRVFIWCLA